MPIPFLVHTISVLCVHYRVYPPTCSECPTQPHTLGSTLCRHNEVVISVSLEVLREGDGGHSALSGGGVPVDQVGVRWVCTIVNGASVHWLKNAIHKCICYVG